MSAYRFNGNRVNRLMKLCSRCVRNYHKVVVRHTDGTQEGFCPSCYADPNQREWLAASGAVLTVDFRGRKPEWDDARKAEARILEDNIARLTALLDDPEIGDFIDLGLIDSNRRQLARMRREIVVDGVTRPPMYRSQ